MFISLFVVCCVCSGLCHKLITLSEESYWVCVCLTVCNLEIPTMRQRRPDLGCCALPPHPRGTVILAVEGVCHCLCHMSVHRKGDTTLCINNQGLSLTSYIKIFIQCSFLKVNSTCRHNYSSDT
jgi:hypothetical protein